MVIISIFCKAIDLSEPCGGVPNSALPLLYYPHVVSSKEYNRDGNNLAAWFELTFARHGWPPRWRYPIYNVTHFHSTTPEALDIYQGQAQVQFGGAKGPVIDIACSDAVLIPAGVGHRQVAASDDFMAVGAYPSGCAADLCFNRPELLAVVRQRLNKVPLPDGDPLTHNPGEGCYHHWGCGQPTDK